jgi:hypothetical protein
MWEKGVFSETYGSDVKARRGIDEVSTMDAIHDVGTAFRFPPDLNQDGDRPPAPRPRSNNRTPIPKPLRGEPFRWKLIRMQA